MPVSMKCPQCEKAFNVPDELAGKKAKCGSCGTVFRVATISLKKEPSGRLETTTDPRDFASAESQPAGIAGWLIIPAVVLVLSPIMTIVQFFAAFLLQDIARALGAESFVEFIWLYRRFWLICMIEITVFLATIIVATLFFTKRRIAVTAIISLMYGVIIAKLCQYLLCLSMFNDAPPDRLIYSTVFAAIWVPYFMRSKRVKNTFTEPK